MFDQSIFRLTNAPVSPIRPRTHQTNRVTNSRASKKQIFDVKPLNEKISSLKKENQKLKDLITHLQGSMVSQKQRDLLIKDFDLDLVEDIGKIEARLTKIDAISKDVNKFSSPNRDVFPKSTLKLKEEAPETLRNQVIKEHEALTQQALFNERQIVIMKMQLKLCHDRRDLVALRENLNVLQGGGRTLSMDKEIEDALKIQIHNIKLKQMQEKFRIEHEKMQDIEKHDAATMIQSLWRGYSYRKKNSSDIEKEHLEMMMKAQEQIKNQSAPSN